MDHPFHFILKRMKLTLEGYVVAISDQRRDRSS